MAEENVGKRDLSELVNEIKAQNADKQKLINEEDENALRSEEEDDGIPEDPVDPIYGLPEFQEAAKQISEKDCCRFCEDWNPVLCRAGDCPAGLFEPNECDGQDEGGIES